ncbi:MAG: DUF1015 domain-containing protein [Saprospiraceae bacterium]
MQLLPFRATLPNLKFITAPEAFFSTVKEDYLEYAASGFFTNTEDPGFYIYRIEQGHKIFTGLIACVDMQADGGQHIIPHEQTLATKEQRQIHLLLKRKATVKPVLLTYQAQDKINFALHQFCQSLPILDLTFERAQQKHTVWAVTRQEDQKAIRDLFNAFVPKAYIADGHHRCATAKRLSQGKQHSPFSKTVCAFFPSSDLEIHDFNRVIDAFSDCSPTYFMARLSQYCNIQVVDAPYKPRKKHELLLYINKEWYQLEWKSSIFGEDQFDPKSLDSLLLNEIILKEILGIEDISNSPRISYIEGPKGLKGLQKKTVEKDTRIGIALYPVQTHELFDLADRSVILPPKSTWFEPRLINGLINYQYD